MDQILPGILVTVVGGLILAGFIWLIQDRLGLFRSRPGASGQPEESLPRFSLDSVPDLQQNCVLSKFHVDAGHAGVEARAQDGGVVKGECLVVVLQHQLHDSSSLTVWLTVENRGAKTIRWFGPVLTAYAEPRYQEIRPKEPDGRSYLWDIYPGEQYTCRYFFPFDEATRGPKYLTCNSWDNDLAFFWARGA